MVSWSARKNQTAGRLNQSKSLEAGITTRVWDLADLLA
ncbi:hypothetical protein SBA4_2780012 [Candidatus Sulfopaludibacter sp. SbA4]|nr:hypothetical protein SBA4_2780012 [Candidatus Sulfopaludibacter sp. SbA4]